MPSDPGFRADRAQADKALGSEYLCPVAALRGQAPLWSSAIIKGTITGAKQAKHQYPQAQKKTKPTHGLLTVKEAQTWLN